MFWQEVVDFIYEEKTVEKSSDSVTTAPEVCGIFRYYGLQSDDFFFFFLVLSRNTLHFFFCIEPEEQIAEGITV